MDLFNVFEVKTKKAGTVYMKTRPGSVARKDVTVVHVDAKKLLLLWQKEPHNPTGVLAFGGESEWRADYKFNCAEIGFLQGQRNPVPLARIVCAEHDKYEPVYKKGFIFFRKLVGYKTLKEHHIGFIDGITRTIWLLANGAESFPIECESSSSQKLIKLAGHSGTEIAQ